MNRTRDQQEPLVKEPLVLCASMNMMITIPTLLVGASFLAGFTAPLPKYSPVKRAVRCPDEAATTGYYRNYSYGFSVSIPRGLKGFWNSARCVKDKRDCFCMGDHGRFIPLDQHSYLEVFVGVQNNETVEESIDDELAFSLKRHKEKGERAELVSRSRARLGGMTGVHWKLRYQDAKTGELMLRDTIIGPPPVDRSHGGFLYSVTLVTPEKLYAERRTLLFSIIKGWKYRSVGWTSRRSARADSLWD